MYCRKCGKWIPDDSNYCNYCGNKITLDKKEKRAVWLLVLFIILCLIATFFSHQVPLEAEISGSSGL